MSVITGQVVTALFTTADATTGAAANAAALPVGTLYLNGVATLDAVTVANIAVGVYRATVTMPALVAGDDAAIRIAATVAGVAGEAAIWQDVRDGFIDNLDAAITAIPASVWAHGVRTLTSFGTLVADIALAVWTYATRTLTSLSGVACAVWTCATRTLTTGTQARQATHGTGTALEFYRGDTLVLNFTGLGDLTLATELWFTHKNRTSSADTAAQIQVSLTGGLLAIAGLPASVPANGSLLITDLVAGNVTLTVEAVEMAKLTDAAVGYWDIQMRTATATTTLRAGNGQVVFDVTRSV